MAHLLVLENWIEGTGRLLPKRIKELGHRYTFVTRKPEHYFDQHSQKMHPIFEFADHVLRCETNDRDILIPFLRAQHQILKFDGIITVCDYYVDIVADVAKALSLGQSFSSNVALERRKHRVRQAMDEHGLPNCPYAVTHNWQETLTQAEQLGFPLIIKPSDLASSAMVKLVKDEAELRSAFDTIGAMTHNFRDQPREPIWLLEAYMEGAEVSVEACSYRGETHIIGVTDKSLTGFPYFIEDGHMFPADLDEQTRDQTIALVKATLEAVGHDHGLSHTEVKLTGDGPRIVEINPRPGGNYIAELIELVTGLDVLKTHIELALNIRPDYDLSHAKAASAAVKFLVPNKVGKLKAIQGLAALNDNPHLHRHSFVDPAGRVLTPTIDNACYLGHVISTDPSGLGARHHAEQAIAELALEVEQ